MINSTVWFAITFWVFLETRSVLATGMVAGIFLVATALSGIWFGSLVDRFRKKTVMQVSTAASLVLYICAFALYKLTPDEVFTDPTRVRLWVFILLSMLGMICGNPRTIALQTLVTALIEPERRDKANGL
ncbi:MFS transporter, partial [Bradyrhizobium sp. NBAIM08]|uniref:MFS transporter n=1 Tax=Bradyrhizobium sp. NBAIM08 TaxID=2793815 RepID=UPI001CD48BAA|nr:MFS transporter [Bradyrhizobium sp. NBAIM08]